MPLEETRVALVIFNCALRDGCELVQSCLNAAKVKLFVMVKHHKGKFIKVGINLLHSCLLSHANVRDPSPGKQQRLSLSTYRHAHT